MEKRRRKRVCTFFFTLTSFVFVCHQFHVPTRHWLPNTSLLAVVRGEKLTSPYGDSLNSYAQFFPAFSELDFEYLDLNSTVSRRSCFDGRRGPVFQRKKGWRLQCRSDAYLLSRTGENIVENLREQPLRHSYRSERYQFPRHPKLRLKDEGRHFFDKLDSKFHNCKVVVATAIFGAQDVLHQPVGLHKFSEGLVCFVAFLDRNSVDSLRLEGGAKCGVWNVVVHYTTGFSEDPRMASRLPKLLLPFYFPAAYFAVWTDSKLQLRLDVMALVQSFLLDKKAYFAVSHNHVRADVYSEANKLKQMFHGALSVNETYDNFREITLSRAVHTYKSEDFDGQGLPDAGLFLVLNNEYTRTLLLGWFNEVIRFPYGRDQIALAYSVWKLGRDNVFFFDRCSYVAIVNEVGHRVRNGDVLGQG